MIARSFKSVAWVAAIGVAVLMCYMVSLRGAAERAELAALDIEMVRLERSIRTLQTELGTRGRVHQLQQWASTDFGFVAPVANQFMEDEVTLARFDRPAEPAPLEAPVRMAQAPATPPAATPPSAAPRAAPQAEPAPQLPRVVRAAAPRPAASAPAQPLLRRAAVEAAAPRARSAPTRVQPARTQPAAMPPTRAAARPATVVSDRTRRDLDARARSEATGRGRAGAN